MISQAVILAGGKGTRLGALAASTPKALVEIAGIPLIVRQFEVLKRYGVSRVLILSGHLGGELAAALGDGRRYGLEISYVREDGPLGTAGALRAAEGQLEDEFYVVYGDIIFDMDLARLSSFHEAHGGLGTLVVHPNDHPQDSDLVETDANDRITAFHTKLRDPATLAPNLVSAAIYVLEREVVAFVPGDRATDFGLDVFPAMVKAGAALYAYNTPEYLKDAGTLHRRETVEADIRSGKVARRNLGHRQVAVFLDRDGVLIEERGDAVTADEVHLLPGVGDALHRLDRSDYLTIVVTNQPGIAKGFITEVEVAAAHARMSMELGEAGAYVHDIEICPHHPERGFPGERPELKIDCDCRKPKPGMLLRAAERFNIDLSHSYMIGDRTIDIEAGQRAGTMTIGVRTGHGYRDGKSAAVPDQMCDDLAGAIDRVLSVKQRAEPA
jgi:mannose-1-phosphate guanylyltransferase/phosphomannomutase